MSRRLLEAGLFGYIDQLALCRLHHSRHDAEGHLSSPPSATSRSQGDFELELKGQREGFPGWYHGFVASIANACILAWALSSTSQALGLVRRTLEVDGLRRSLPCRQCRRTGEPPRPGQQGRDGLDGRSASAVLFFGRLFLTRAKSICARHGSRGRQRDQVSRLCSRLLVGTPLKEIIAGNQLKS